METSTYGHGDLGHLKKKVEKWLEKLNFFHQHNTLLCRKLKSGTHMLSCRDQSQKLSKIEIRNSQVYYYNVKLLVCQVHNKR